MGNVWKMSERILTVDHCRIRTEEFSCNTSRIGNDEEGVSGDIGYSVRSTKMMLIMMMILRAFSESGN